MTKTIKVTLDVPVSDDGKLLLPGNLSVSGDLYLTDTEITALPDNLSVCSCDVGGDVVSICANARSNSRSQNSACTATARRRAVPIVVAMGIAAMAAVLLINIFPFWFVINKAVFTELGLTDEDDPIGQIDVAAIEPDHFAGT
ncbi:hypothetical protein [Bradyrhizobium sp. WSM2254]|uniref:hypothetical protein n=1 Tax=Bradyrhizobium sp. WSM2254 TaxID=1188263 RepID=UPI001FD9BE50|nr:hypothetical protein [Bradyrhizobium sp. WSM2254]